MSDARKDPPSELSQQATGMPQFFPANAEFTSAMIRLGQSYGEGLSLLTQEILNFASKRLSKNVATMQAICSCKEAGEARQIQQDWIDGATMDYADHMGSLLNLAVRVTAEAFRPVGEQSEASMDPARTAK